jgi:hypothetical protein
MMARSLPAGLSGGAPRTAAAGAARTGARKRLKLSVFQRLAALVGRGLTWSDSGEALSDREMIALANAEVVRVDPVGAEPNMAPLDGRDTILLPLCRGHAIHLLLRRPR